MSDPKTSPETAVTSDPEASPETAVTGDPETSPETAVTGDPETSPETAVTSDPEASPETAVTSDPEASPETAVTSDPEASPEATVTRRRRRRRPWLWLLLLVVLVLLALAGGVVRYGWPPRLSGQQAQQTQKMQQMQQQFQALHNEVAKAQDAVQSLRHDLATATASVDSNHKAVDSNHKAISTLDQNAKGLQDSVGHLRNQISGGSQSVQLGAVERLLLMANDEIQLARDPVTADHALAAADRRLATLDSPRLFALRQVIAQERAVLKAVDEPDLAATALTLTQLIEQIPQLPLRTQPYAIKQELPDPTADHTQSQGGFARSWQNIGIALRSLFHLRRTDRPIEPMLTQAQATLAGQILSLRLDTARTALVQRNTQIYRSALDSAQHGLKLYYRVDAPSVQGQLDQLTKLSTLELNPPLPDISYSVGLLRELRDNPPS